MASTQTVASEHLDYTDVRHRYGKGLIRTAWGLEIIAAAIGLFIALATAFATHSEILAERIQIGASEWMTIFIGALPFLMVAIVELMKIPLATAFFLSQNRIWRLIFLVSLILLIVITFETMLNGFQRQYESRVYLVTELRTRLIALDESIAETGRRIQDLKSITVESVRQEYSKNLTEIREARKSDIAEIDKERTNQQASIGRTATTTLREERKSIREDINRLREEERKEIAEFISSYRSDSERSVAALQKERDQLNERVRRLDDQITTLEEKRGEELARCEADLFCSEDKIRKRYDIGKKELVDEKTKIGEQLARLSTLKTQADFRTQRNRRIQEIRSKYDTKITPLENRLRSLVKEIDGRESRSAETVKPVLTQLNARRQEIVVAYKKQEAEVEERFQRRLMEAENREANIRILQDDLAEKQQKKNDLRNQINSQAKDNQIYQIAALWYGKESPVDVTKDELKFISALWFGSLSFVVAVIGTVLAFAGLVLRYHDRQVQPPFMRAAFSSIRRASVEFRRWLRKRPDRPKTVIKEVPVEKIVFRDVPREVVVKELVYVPLYTNDPKLLNLDYGVGLEKENDSATSRPQGEENPTSGQNNNE